MWRGLRSSSGARPARRLGVHGAHLRRVHRHPRRRRARWRTRSGSDPGEREHHPEHHAPHALRATTSCTSTTCTRSTGSTVSALKADPRPPRDLAQSTSLRWAKSSRVFPRPAGAAQALRRGGQLGPFKNGYWGTRAYQAAAGGEPRHGGGALPRGARFPKDIVRSRPSSAAEPHPNWLVGGVPCAISVDGVGRARSAWAPQPNQLDRRSRARVRGGRSTSRTSSRSRPSGTGSSAAASRQEPPLVWRVPSRANDELAHAPAAQSMKLGAVPRRRPHRSGRIQGSSITTGFVPDRSKGLHPGTASPKRNFLFLRPGWAHEPKIGRSTEREVSRSSGPALEEPCAMEVGPARARIAARTPKGDPGVGTSIVAPEDSSACHPSAALLHAPARTRQATNHLWTAQEAPRGDGQAPRCDQGGSTATADSRPIRNPRTVAASAGRRLLRELPRSALGHWPDREHEISSYQCTSSRPPGTEGPRSRVRR